MQSLFTFVCQEICKRQRFWWRNGLVTFTIQTGVATYDLTSITTVPANQLSQIAVEEITAFKLVVSPNPLQFGDVSPVFDTPSLIAMMANTLPAQPSRYTFDANDYKKIRVDLPDANYTAYLAYWAMPNPTTDTSSDVVPLIPPWGHNAVVSGMNAKIFKFAYGSKNPKTIDAQAEYEQAIQDLEMRKDFSGQKRTSITIPDLAVQSY